MQNVLLSLLYFYLAYVVVTLIGILHTIFNVKVLHMKNMKQSKGMGEAYEATKPWHPLYNLIIFPIFGYFYLSGLLNPKIEDAFITGALWTLIAIVVDYVGWILIKHPWRLTYKQFYVDYQPWITIIYTLIFFGPIISFWLFF